MQEKKCNTIREMAILRKNQKEIIEIKNTVTEMKYAFDGLFVHQKQSRKNFWPNDKSIDIPKVEKKREKRLTKKKRLGIKDVGMRSETEASP